MSDEREPIFAADPDGYLILAAGPATVTLPSVQPGAKITVKNCGSRPVNVGAPPWPRVIEPGSDATFG